MVRPLILQPITIDLELQSPQSLKKKFEKDPKIYPTKISKKATVEDADNEDDSDLENYKKTDLIPVEKFNYRRLSFDKRYYYTSKRKPRDRYRPGYLYRGRLYFVRINITTKVKTL